MEKRIRHANITRMSLDNACQPTLTPILNILRILVKPRNTWNLVDRVVQLALPGATRHGRSVMARFGWHSSDPAESWTCLHQDSLDIKDSSCTLR